MSTTHSLNNLICYGDLTCLDTLSDFETSFTVVAECITISLLLLVLSAPVLGCINFLEIMLKFEFIYILLIVLWLENLSKTDHPKIIALMFLLAVCCESVSGLTILIVLRSYGTGLVDASPNNKLRG